MVGTVRAFGLMLPRPASYYAADLVASVALLISIWILGKFGSSMLLSLVAGLVYFMMGSFGLLVFIGVMLRGVTSDITLKLFGYRNSLTSTGFRAVGPIVSMAFAAATANGVTSFLYGYPAILVAVKAASHAVFGAVGGALGVIIFKALKARITT